jgi:DNA-binding MarR family transcriptional regulator
MHSISFLLKRCHLKVTAFAKEAVRSVKDMTPLRFDVLCFARQRWIQFDPCRTPRGLTTQRAITRALGLHPSTISKLLKRLEELGWITRFPDYVDPRVKGVELTPLGVRKAWEAMRRVFRGRLLLKPFEAVARALRPTAHVIEGVEHLYDTLELIADFFGDESTFYYDYGLKSLLPYRFVQQPRRSTPIRIRQRPEFTIIRPGTPRWSQLIADYCEREREKRIARGLPVIPRLAPSES